VEVDTRHEFVRPIRWPVGIEGMEDIVSANREIEAIEPGRAAATAALPKRLRDDNETLKAAMGSAPRTQPRNN
jgi:hypothetical protein